MCTSSAGRSVAAIVVSLLCTARPLAAGETAAERFARGRALVEDNCGEAYPKSRKVLEDGIADILAAVREGVDTADAHRLLACAYATLGSRFATPDERLKLASKELEALRSAATRDPRDVTTRLEIAALTADQQEALDAYEAVLGIAPDHAVALYASGKLLLRRNQTEKALERLERAGEMANPRQARAWGGDVVRILREQGRRARAEELKVKLDAKAKAAPIERP